MISMRRKIISVLLTGSMLASLTACSSGSTSNGKASKDVKVGFLWPISGGSSTIGQQHNDGAKMAIAEINANGGIKSMGGAKIIPIVADSETKPDVGATQTERLITKEKVSMVVGPYNSTVALASVPVAERNKTPFISMGGVSNKVTTSGYKWVVRVNNMANYDNREIADGISIIEKENKFEVKTIGFCYENSDWGNESAKIMQKLATDKGWKIIVNEPVANGQSDMNSQVLKIKRANPDVLYSAFYTPETILFTKALKANNVVPKYGHWTAGGGAQDPAFFKAVDQSNYNYMFVQEDWDLGQLSRAKWVQDLAEKVQTEKGYKLNSFFAQGWTAAYVAYEALEAAGKNDKEAIRAALNTLDIKKDDTGKSRANLTGYPEIKFDATGQNTFSSGTIIQYVNGKGIPLSPIQNRITPDARAICPIPGSK